MPDEISAQTVWRSENPALLAGGKPLTYNFLRSSGVSEVHIVRLADFIRANIGPILVEWDSFARKIRPAGTGPSALPHSTEQILRAVIADMGTSQSLRAQLEKSHGYGEGGAESDRLDRASQLHGAARAGSGLALPAVVAEYRALRASVLRLWRAAVPNPNLHDLEDLTRFNEAIDQSLARASEGYTHRMDVSRKMFLGILGHDLRNPLSAITLTAKVAMTHPADSDVLREQLSQIIDSAKAISELVTDLIDFASSTVRLPIMPGHYDLHVLANEVIRELRAARPGRSIRFKVSGDITGTWDGHRLRQVIANLLSNALQHGSPTEPVDLTVDGTDTNTVLIAVHNTGPPIPAEVLPTIFDPLVRGPTSIHEGRASGSIGLGLYIVREIAIAHGGTAELTSTSNEGTTATVRLPRHVTPDIRA